MYKVEVQGDYAKFYHYSFHRANNRDCDLTVVTCSQIYAFINCVHWNQIFLQSNRDDFAVVCYNILWVDFTDWLTLYMAA